MGGFNPSILTSELTTTSSSPNETGSGSGSHTGEGKTRSDPASPSLALRSMLPTPIVAQAEKVATLGRGMLGHASPLTPMAMMVVVSSKEARSTFCLW